MRKWSAVPDRVLFALLAILPLGNLLCSGFGYVFELRSLPAHGIVTALIAVAALLLSGKETADSGHDKLLIALLAPLSLVCALIQFFQYSGTLGVLSALICAICCSILSIRQGRPRFVGVLAGLLCGAMALLALSPYGLFVILMGSFGEETVVRTVPSPDGVYVAELIDDDQGALGGGTRVVVHEREYNAWLFRVVKKPQEVYWGPWGEYKDLEICWEDEHHLVVKNKVYEIR